MSRMVSFKSRNCFLGESLGGVADAPLFRYAFSKTPSYSYSTDVLPYCTSAVYQQAAENMATLLVLLLSAFGATDTLPSVDCVFLLTATGTGGATLVPRLLEELAQIGLRARTTVLESEPDCADAKRGCFDAHRRAWSRAENLGCEHTLVLEDDAFFVEGLRESGLVAIEQWLRRRTPFDLIYLGYGCDWPFAGEPVGPLVLERDGPLVRVDGALFTHAYIIARRSAAAWAEHLQYDGSTALDVAMRSQRPRAYATYPMIAFQRFHMTSISRYETALSDEGVVAEGVWTLLSNRLLWGVQHLEAAWLRYTYALSVLERAALLDAPDAAGELCGGIGAASEQPRHELSGWSTHCSLDADVPREDDMSDGVVIAPHVEHKLTMERLCYWFWVAATTAYLLTTIITLLVWRSSSPVATTVLILAATRHATRRRQLLVLVCCELLYLLSGPPSPTIVEMPMSERSVTAAPIADPVVDPTAAPTAASAAAQSAADAHSAPVTSLLEQLPAVIIGDAVDAARLRHIGLALATHSAPVYTPRGKLVGVWLALQAALRMRAPVSPLGSESKTMHCIRIPLSTCLALVLVLRTYLRLTYMLTYLLAYLLACLLVWHSSGRWNNQCLSSRQTWSSTRAGPQGCPPHARRSRLASAMWSIWAVWPFGVGGASHLESCLGAVYALRLSSTVQQPPPRSWRSHPIRAPSR